MHAFVNGSNKNYVVSKDLMLQKNDIISSSYLCFAVLRMCCGTIVSKQYDTEIQLQLVMIE